MEQMKREDVQFTISKQRISTHTLGLDVKFFKKDAFLPHGRVRSILLGSDLKTEILMENFLLAIGIPADLPDRLEIIRALQR